MFTKEMINDYANKLLIGLSEEEVSDLLDEFDVIKENMDIIDSIEGLKDVKPLSFPQDTFVTTLRSDGETRTLDTRDALANSKGTIEDVVSVPKVVG